MERATAASIRERWGWIVIAVLVGTSVAILPHMNWRIPAASKEAGSAGPAVGMPGAPPTSAEGLRRRIDEMERRLADRPQDQGASILLADALLRQARVTGEGRLSARSASLLTSVLKESPADYDALRLLGVANLSQHRFREALEIGRRARNLRPDDASVYGVVGDASLELGDYDAAFEAFDTMIRLRPGAAAYARVAYARELQGNLTGALKAMEMAREASSAHDPEALAWYGAQVGDLYMKLGRPDQAEREFRRAAFAFPDYPFAVAGIARLAVARGDREQALAIYLDQLKRAPTLDLAARIGDLYAQTGRHPEAERYYQLAEDLAGPAAFPTEATLALFLAEHDRKLDEAVRIAEAVAAIRHDIFTDDALAWAYFKVGRIDDARVASARALRTGTREERILSHAEQIRAAAGRRVKAASPAGHS
jgi:tetratricopeptide (TPR) repeat protein